MDNSDRAIYLGAVLWGEEFRRYFLDYCLASLLADGNIPVLRDIPGSRFLICTTNQDWTALNLHPSFKRLAQIVEPEHVPLATPGTNESKLHVMSRGHRAIAERMFSDRVFGSFVYPDTVFADGSIAGLVRHAAEGKKVVLAFCPRFANEHFLLALDEHGRDERDGTVTLSGRQLLTLTLPHMHSETRTYDFESPWFSLRPVMCSWRVRDGSGLVFHTTNWAPVLIDYRALNHHDTGALENWTIDGDYVFRNFPSRTDIHLVTDSDDMTLISFTLESSLSYLPLRSEPIQHLPLLGPWFRSLALRAFLHAGEIDPLKLELFPTPVLVRTTKGDRREWERAKTRAARVARHAAVAPLSQRERRALVALRILNEGVLRHFGYWRANRRRVRRAVD